MLRAHRAATARRRGRAARQDKPIIYKLTFRRNQPYPSAFSQLVLGAGSGTSLTRKAKKTFACASGLCANDPKSHCDNALAVPTLTLSRRERGF